MAKGTAICTCKTCGKKFEKTSTRGNRADANAWEEWAVRTYTECPSCYGKRKHQEELDAGLICRLRLSTGMEPKLVLVAYGDTYPIKDQFKAAGWIYSDFYPNPDDFFGMRRPYSRWIKLYDLCEIIKDDAIDPTAAQEILDGIAALGFVRHELEIGNMEILLAIKEIKTAQEEKAKKAAAEAALFAKRGPKPKRPAWMPEGRWNGRIYGKTDRTIYLDGVKTNLTDSQTADLEQYISDLERWRAAGEEKDD